MPQRTRRALSLFAAGLLLAVPSFATTLYLFTPEELVAHAAIIAVVEVRSVRSVESRGRISTFAEVEVSSAIRGTAPGAALTIVVPGGVAGDLVEHVEGAPQLVEGETCLAYLEPAGRGLQQFVGLSQGHLVLAPDPAVPGGFVIVRELAARLVRRDAEGVLKDVAPPPAREPLQPFLEQVRRLSRTTR